RSVVSFGVELEAQLSDLEVSAYSPWLWLTNYVFDASLKGVMSLCHGRTVVLASDEQSKDPSAIVSLLGMYEIEVLNTTPLLMQAVLEPLAQSELAVNLILSGDQISEELFTRVSQYSDTRDVRWINAYGPTEATVNSSYGVIDDVLHIGRGTANTKLYVLSDALVECPIGTVGELYIGGAGVARGYLNRDELTAEKFVDSPYEAGQRLYCTGDMVRWRSEGQLEFIGRKDRQLKIRGYRVEPDEIERVLLQHPDVSDVLVCSFTGAMGEQQLVAYIVSELLTTEDSDGLEYLIEESLPDYMMPAAFEMMSSFPLTAGGKVNVRELPTPSMGAGQHEYVAPRTDTERVLCTIWQEVLGIEQVGVTDNFF
ncbi:AMP-binding protein, partial [Pseudoalteromonas sp. MMG007]|uniref:AMP-binding protein n=1 Tax=Pseudoalteromonas sp. MMG007 TaxID=2822684 RepID=UPI001B39A59A